MQLESNYGNVRGKFITLRKSVAREFSFIFNFKGKKRKEFGCCEIGKIEINLSENFSQPSSK